ncbi:MAG: MBL fold metallo-hydrolase [Anaerolineae bacterium]|nr:MAG: MBL fold metallo-hydrolase [Anaerolineae bacterium]
MRRERIAEEIYVFTSDLYAQVTAGVILTEEGAIVIDTLPFPQETAELKAFIDRHNRQGARYVINTHHHADHVYGNYLFPEAELLAHERCRRIMLRQGQRGLDEAKAQTPALAEVRLCIPEVVFDRGELIVHLGGKSLHLVLTPGHTIDSISVLVKEDKVLFAADTVMPVPYIVFGDLETMVDSLRQLGGMAIDTIVQGHGEVLLRGELSGAIETDIRYLEIIWQRVRSAVEAGAPKEALRRVDIEECGKSRIPLNGLVQQLHLANLMHLYERISAQSA